MRAVALHPDVIVVVSSVWQTTCTAVRSGDEGFVIDSPVLPDELDALPGLLEQASFPVSGLLATHGDWDHLLGRTVFADASLGVCESTATRLEGSPGEPQRRLRAFDREWYIEARPPLGLGSVQSLPAPGRLSIGDEEVEVHPAVGHTGDGCAFRLPWCGVLVSGDYLCPVEDAQVNVEAGGSVDAYLATLDRFAALLADGGTETVIPGHGGPMDVASAARVLDRHREQLLR